MQCGTRPGSWNRKTSCLGPCASSALNSCVTESKLLCYSMPQFSHLWNADGNTVLPIMFLWGFKWQPIEHIAHCRVWQSKPRKCELQYPPTALSAPERNIHCLPTFFHESSVLASLSGLTLKFKELDPEYRPTNKSSFHTVLPQGLRSYHYRRIFFWAPSFQR